MAAVQSENLEIVKLLVENGANINESELLRQSKAEAIKEYLILKGAH